MEKSHMLGEFLVKNHVVTEQQMERAIREQHTQAQTLSLMAELESILSKEEIDRATILARQKGDTLENSIIDMGLVSSAELNALLTDDKKYRIPLGQVLLKNGDVNREMLDLWLTRFNDQEFDDTDVIELLKSIPLFSELEHKYLKQIYGNLKPKQFLPGEVVYKEGMTSNTLFIIKSGLVRLTVNSSSQQIELSSRHSGDYFGMSGLLSDAPRSERATAIIKSDVWRLERDDLTPILLENPQLAVAAARELSDEIQDVLRGVNQNRRRIDTGNIHVVIMDEDVDPNGELASDLARELFVENGGEALLIHSMPMASWPQLEETGLEGLEEALPEKIESGVGGTLSSFYVRNIEQEHDTEKFSRWLNEQSDIYDAIYFFIHPGEIEVRQLSMGVCRRSVTIIKGEAPPFLKYLKPRRDRAYLLQNGSKTSDLKRYREIMDVMEDNLVCLAPHALKIDDSRKALGGISRFLSGKSIGLALGGGGARGFAHLGIIKVLEQEGFVIDALSGASAGSILAGQYCFGFNPKEILNFCLKNIIGVKGNPFDDWRLPFRKGSFAKGKKARKLLRSMFGNSHCLHTERAFFPVATDMGTGREFVIRDATMHEAILASGAGPGLLPLIHHKGRILADGALVNNVPASVLKDYGCDFVISSNISIDPEKATPVNDKSVMNILMHSLDILMNNSVDKHKKHSDFDLQPPVDKFGILDFQMGQELMEIGVNTITRRLGELKRKITKSGIQLQPIEADTENIG